MLLLWQLHRARLPQRPLPRRKWPCRSALPAWYWMQQKLPHPVRYGYVRSWSYPFQSKGGACIACDRPLFARQIGAFKNPHFSIRTVCGRIPLVCDRRGRILFYTQEESAVLGGFLSSYLNRDSASDHVRDAFARFQVGLERGCLQKSELQWAEQTLLALKPLWWEEWEDHRALMSALLKTQALLRADE
jgi:hypothetical protein